MCPQPNRIFTIINHSRIQMMLYVERPYSQQWNIDLLKKRDYPTSEHIKQCIETKRIHCCFSDCHQTTYKKRTSIERRIRWYHHYCRQMKWMNVVYKRILCDKVRSHMCDITQLRSRKLLQKRYWRRNLVNIDKAELLLTCECDFTCTLLNDVIKL